MSKIDTTGWQEFALVDLCDIFLSHDDLQPKQLDEGEIRLVSAGTSNNGVVMCCDAPDAEVFEAGCVTVDMFGQCFWQDEPFVAVSHGRINILKFKEPVGDDAGKVFAAILNARLSGKYSFENMCNQKLLSSEKILLPAVSVEVPDWDYMEQYMTQIMDEMRPVAEELHQLESILSFHPLDVSNWKEFKVGDLFEVLKTGFIGEGRKIGQATKIPDDEHVVPLTCAKQGNNGVMYWGRAGDFITYENVISVIRDGAVSTGLVYAQEQETGVYSHSYFIRAKDYTRVSFLANQFVACVLEKVIYPKYTRDDACIWPKVQNEIIKLPVTPDGKPDWDMMAEMMRGYTNSVREVANVLYAID